MKMSETTDLTYYQKICDSKIERDVILNRSKDYYQNNKERLRVEARDKYRNSSEEKKKQRIWEEQISQYAWRKEAKNKRISNKLSKKLS